MRIVEIVKICYKRLFLSIEKQAKEAGVNTGEGNVFYFRFWSSEPYLITNGNHCQIMGGYREVHRKEQKK